MTRVALAVGLLGLLPSGCSYLEEQRVEPTQVVWSGSVLDQPYSSTAGPFTGGTFAVTTPDGEAVADATESDPGTWSVTVPVNIPVVLRLAGDGYATTVWQSQTPTGRAYWFTGALYAQTQDAVATFFSGLGDLGLLAAPAEDLSQSTVVHLIGAPLVPDDWAGAALSLTDGAGEDIPVVALAAADDGTLFAAGSEDPIAAFAAANLAPGAVSLSVQTADGRVLDLSWLAAGGDLLSPMFLALPESS